MKKLTLLLLIVASLSTLTAVRWLKPVAAQTETAERRIKVGFAPDAPITVTAIRNLQGKEWWKTFELEVKNVSDKPIYSMHLRLGYPKVLGPNGRPMGVPLNYGRGELSRLSIATLPDEAAIKPGETYVFKINEGYWHGLEHQNSRTDVEPDALNHLELYISFVRVGDDTGYNGFQTFKLRNVQDCSP